MAANNSTRLKSLYKDEVVPALIKEYGNCIFTNKQLKTTNFSLKITSCNIID